MHPYRNGRHENGQNFLTDRKTIATITDLVARTAGPIVEIGPGGGALTHPIAGLGRPLTVVEIDARLARLLARDTMGISVIHADFLSYRLPDAPHCIVGNLPFHLTTAILRKLLHASHWTDAVLLMQWEVARRRAGVGGSSMMTAQWMPWYEFRLAQKVSASAFAPRPTVDAGLITITRRRSPLVPVAERGRYTSFVHRVFTGRGHGLPAILHAMAPRRRTDIRRWVREQDFTGTPLPRDLTVGQWVEIYALLSQHRDMI